MDPRAPLSTARRVVVKLGTTVLAHSDGAVALGRIAGLVEQLHRLRASGVQVILVSSGAVGLGLQRLGFDRSPERTVDRQACAAAGQGALMALYDQLFQRLGTVCAQVLITEEDFHFRQRFNNLSATLDRLLDLGAIPIINENDTVSTAELAGEVFGDNDRLSALVASYMGADALLLLTDVDALYTAPPGTPGAEPIDRFTDETAWTAGEASALGRGGIGSKVEAARLAAASGVTTVVAYGGAPDVVADILASMPVGTVFPAQHGTSRRRRWLAFGTAPVGVLDVNDGARAAITRRNASLLPVGVVAVSGQFVAGDVVRVCCDGVEFARGVVSRSSEEVRVMLSQPTSGPDRALVHRDDLVLT